MNKITAHLFNLLFLLIGNQVVFAQQTKALEVLSNVEAYYKTKEVIDLEVEYKMYRGYTGDNLTESYTGFLYKNGEVLQMKILGSEIVQFPQAQITIDQENKTLYYNKVTDDKPQNSPLDMSAFLTFYKEGSTRITGNNIIIELIKKNAKIPISYNKIILTVNKESYALEKQELYLATKVPFVDNEGNDMEDVGRIKVTFKTNPTPANKKLKLEDYVVLERNNKVLLAKPYKEYSIIDQTKL